MDDDSLLTREEAAREAGVCPRTICRWMRRGFLNCITVPGRTVRFRREDVLEVEQRHQKRHRWEMA